MKRECKICKSKVIKRFRSIYDNRHGYPGKFSIYECPNCGFMQTEPRLTSGKLSNVYTNYYPKRDADVKGMIENIKHLPSKKEIYRQGNETDCHFQTEKGQNVLDIGCGTCQSLLFIKRLGGNAWGLDPDKNSQNVAKELKLRFHLGTIHNCKFPKKHFDLITASQVLEHEPDPIAFLKDTRKFLKKGGKIVMSFPNTGALYRKIWGRNWLHWHVPYHLNHFNRKSLKIMARKTGFKIISLRTVTPNLWTILQIRSYINSPKMGQRVPMWDGGTQTKGGNESLLAKIMASILPLINRLLSVNRIIDGLGFGESFLIELKPVLQSRSR